MPFTPNTGSRISEGRTSSGLSTQIIIKIGGVAVGALQKMDVRQNRPLERVKEIGTDGCIEIVPRSATEYTISVDRLVFDQLRLPEAFSRAFRFIGAQRIPFDIDIYDISATTPNSDPATNGVIVMKYKNCWFSSYDTPYAADNYLITERAEIWAETAFVSNPAAAPSGGYPSGGVTLPAPGSDLNNIESGVNYGGRRGSLDASGLFNSLFKDGKGSSSAT